MRMMERSPRNMPVFHGSANHTVFCFVSDRSRSQITGSNQVQVVCIRTQGIRMYPQALWPSQHLRRRLLLPRPDVFCWQQVAYGGHS